jgi:hypothetical protein
MDEDRKQGGSISANSIISHAESTRRVALPPYRKVLLKGPIGMKLYFPAIRNTDCLYMGVSS